MQKITASEVSRLGSSQMNLDVGRINPREALWVALLSLSSLAVGTLGAFIAWLVLPSEFASWSGWRFLFFLFGLGVALLGFGLAVVLCKLTYDDWTQYRARLNEWHIAALEAYQLSDGKEVERTLTLSDLSPSVPLHMLAVALSAHRRVAQGTANAFSVRGLEGPVFLGGVRMGDLSPSAAELAAKNLAQLGLIKGRGPRQAGEWAASSEADVVGLLVDNWKRL
ncbi:hypothetical protein VSS37_07900 [Candidatus Thiothrix sp. Deng01]|uniref:Uncharacterized protein n=1 Tax=Candidatus Thiothrix phosphatis TaxID=3112415 RepID=A0ABU6CVP6_9GAMM|nr:hypothetical protein [Candidatus Thiothrix sp. Deng01]MEB4590896.1 hypothetical protein [Candidatus Thiothrix sp. Deng01]